MLKKLNYLSNIMLLVAVIYIIYAQYRIRDIQLQNSALISNLIAQSQNSKINFQHIEELNSNNTDNVEVKIKNTDKKYTNFSATLMDGVVISTGKTELTQLKDGFYRRRSENPTRGNIFLLIENPTDLIEVEDPTMVKRCIMKSMVQSVNNHILFIPEELSCLIADKVKNYEIEKANNEDNLYQAELISAQEISKRLESSQGFKNIPDSGPFNMRKFTKEALSVESLRIPKGTKIQGKIPKPSKIIK